jgi:hypothetical protein
MVLRYHSLRITRNANSYVKWRGVAAGMRMKEAALEAKCHRPSELLMDSAGTIDLMKPIKKKKKRVILTTDESLMIVDQETLQK